jgi:hypothetical protein
MYYIIKSFLSKRTGDGPVDFNVKEYEKFIDTF